MQLPSVSMAGTQPQASVRLGLAQSVFQLLQATPEQRLRRDQQLDQRDERADRRRSDFQQLVAEAAAAPKPLDAVVQAERDMAPGSQSARAAQVADQAERQASMKRQSAARTSPSSDTRSESPTAARAAATKPLGANAQAADSDSAQSAGKRAAAGSVSGSSTTATRPVAPQPAVPVAHDPASAASAAHRAASSVALSSASPAATTTTAQITASARSAAGGAAAPAVTAVGKASPAPTTTRGTAPAPVAEAPRSTGAARRSAAPAATPSAAEPDGNIDANIERIVRLVNSRLGKDRSVTTMRLDPPELGSVRLRMELNQEQLALRIETETPAAQRLLTDQLDTLRQSLQAAGIRLEHVEVRVPPPPGAEAQTPQYSGGSPNQDFGGGSAGTSAGGGLAGGRDSPTPQPESNSGSVETILEPAAESSVNIWA